MYFGLVVVGRKREREAKKKVVYSMTSAFNNYPSKMPKYANSSSVPSSFF